MGFKSAAVLAVLLACCSHTAAQRFSVLQNSEDVPDCGANVRSTGDRIDGSNGPGLELSSVEYGANSVAAKCKKDVLSRFSSPDLKAEVGHVKRGQLDCKALGVSPDMESFEFEFQSEEYKATKTYYQQFVEVGGRHVWVGQLMGEIGYVTVVWNNACDPNVFQMDVNLATGVDNKKNKITTVPCSGDTEGVASCMWMAKVKTESRDEADGFSDTDRDTNNRRLEAEHLEANRTPETLAIDANVRLLERMDAGDADALEHFHSNGGRRLEASRQLLMPDGSLMDDGTVVKVLFLYASKSRRDRGDQTMQSVISAGVATANAALRNSNAGFTIDPVIMYVNYEESTQDAALSALNANSISGVAQMRTLYAADLVQMTVESGQYCGYGNLLTSMESANKGRGFSVVNIDCIGGLSHIHEIGHNMGCEHDRSASGGYTEFKAYGVGFRYCQGADSAPYYRSVMSYGCDGSTRVPYFSNPGVNYQNKPTGRADADNARVLRDTRRVVANFETGGAPAPAPAPPAPVPAPPAPVPAPPAPVPAPPAPVPAPPAPVPAPPAPVPAPPAPVPQPPAPVPAPPAPVPVVVPVPPAPGAVLAPPSYGGGGGFTTIIDMSNYDYSPRYLGQGVTYYDTGRGNQASSSYRRGQYVDASAGLLAYTTAGEWLDYTREFSGGTYSLFMTGGSASGYSARMKIDVYRRSGRRARDTDETHFSFENTGGWSRFETRQVATDVYIPEGTYTIRVSFKAGGVNVKSLAFKPDEEGSDAKKGQALPSKKFYSTTGVANAATDLRGVQADSLGRVSWIDAGDSIVLTLSAAAAGTYQVSYSLAGDGPKGTTLRMFLLKGRASCKANGGNAMAAGGVFGASNFKTGGWNKYNAFGATPLKVAAGAGQEYTLCFEKASWVVLGAICIADKCL